MSKEVTLGKKLKQLRELSGLTLRQIEEATQISNAYLSQLENDKIRRPSANFLYKLATIYGTDMTDLLHAAGLISDDQFKSESSFLNGLNAGQITENEERQLLQYLQFLRQQKRNP